MFVKHMTLEGVEGDVEIAATDKGALVTVGNRVICEVLRDESREARFDKAIEVTKCVCGVDRKGRVNATNSMIHDVFNEMNRVAGC